MIWYFFNKEIVNNVRFLVYFYKIKNYGYEGSKKYFIKKMENVFWLIFLINV